jgi:hypothetical protein
LFTLPSSPPTLAHSLPPPYAQASCSIHCLVLMLSLCSLQNINNITAGVRSGLHFPPTTTSSVLPALFDALPPPLSSLPPKTWDCPGNPANCCSSLKLKPVLAPLPSQSSYSHGPALLCPFGVPRVGNLPDGERSKANGGGAHDGGALFDVGFCGEVLIPL